MELSGPRDTLTQMTPLPSELERERDELIREIYAAFEGVSRTGGVSWSEADEIDGYGTDEMRAAARAADTEPGWVQLVDDSSWNIDPGSRFSFLDAIGFRYYLAPAMIRCARSGYDEGSIAFKLTAKGGLNIDSYRREQWSLLDERQQRCVARFLRYMIASDTTKPDGLRNPDWGMALRSYWAEAT